MFINMYSTKRIYGKMTSLCFCALYPLSFNSTNIMLQISHICRKIACYLGVGAMFLAPLLVHVRDILSHHFSDKTFLNL